MDYSTEKRTTVNVGFGYWKQGDDFSSCGGDLEAFAQLHESIAKHSRESLDNIPVEAIPFVSGDGDTHCCFLSGPVSVMKRLVELKLASKWEDENDDYDFEGFDNNVGGFGVNGDEEDDDFEEVEENSVKNRGG